MIVRDSFFDMRKAYERGEYTPEMVVYYAVKKASQGADGPNLRGFCALMRDVIPLIKYPAKPNKFADIFVPKPWESVSDVYAYVTYWCESFVETIDWLRDFVEERLPAEAEKKLTAREKRAERNEEIRRMREAGMTQQAIADQVGISQPRVNEVLSGKSAEKTIPITPKPKRQNIYLPPDPPAAASRIRKTFGDSFADALVTALMKRNNA